MKLIIGLGNPGKKYEKTRHNAGFLAIDKMANGFQFSIPELSCGQTFNFHPKFNTEIAEGMINDKKVILARPHTFMNNSGKAVEEIMGYYKIDARDIIVIHDDIDIPLGKYKIIANRSSAGHKGVQSIIDQIGTKNFSRIRIGVEIENRKTPTEKFVLERFGKEELEILEKVIEEIIEKIVTLLNC